MGVILTKTHLLTGELKSSGSAVTFCGKVGWEEDVADEYTDAENRRFEATTEQRRVTCKVCRRAAGIVG